MTDRLTVLDATFLELEQLDQGALMNIGGVMVFERPAAGVAPAIERVRDHLAARLGRLPRYSQRLSSTRTGSWAWPHWTQDERFDIRGHIRRASLPTPGSDEQLCDWTADFFSHPLDRTRPLWEMVLIDGLADGYWALGWKTHHCLVDGVGSVDVVGLMLDPEPVSDEVTLPAGAAPASPMPDVDGGDHRDSRLPRPPEMFVQAAQAGARVATSGVSTVRHPRAAFDRSRALAELLMRDEIAAAPRTSLNVPIGQTRRYAVVRVPLAELKALGRELGGSVNDVVLAACSSGLRGLLLSRGEDPPAAGLRAMVPMNLRDTSGRLALGNRVTSLFVALPVAEDDPQDRLDQIAAATKRLKSSGAAGGPTALLDLAALAPPVVVHATLARTQYSTRLFNVTITNVPGQQQPLYAFGSLMREIYPFVPLAAEHAVAIAIFSYNGSVTFGISADSESTPDIDVLACGIESGLEELRALARDPVTPA